MKKIIFICMVLYFMLLMNSCIFKKTDEVNSTSDITSNSSVANSTSNITSNSSISNSTVDITDDKPKDVSIVNAWKNNLIKNQIIIDDIKFTGKDGSFDKDYHVVGKYSDDEIVMYNEVDNSINLYNINTKQVNELTKKITNDSDVYFQNIQYEEGYVSWLECNLANYDQWDMYLYKVSEEKLIKVDEFKYSIADFPIQQNVHVKPVNIIINEDRVIYARLDFNEKDEIVYKVKLYDVKNDNLEDLDETKFAQEEIFRDVALYGNKVAYAKYYRSIDSSPVYDEADIYLYDINTKEKKVILGHTDVNGIYLYDNILAYAKVENYTIPDVETVQSHADISFYYLDSGKTETIVEDSFPIYAQDGIKSLRGLPKLNDKYLSWHDSLTEFQYIYDYKNKQLIYPLKEDQDKEAVSYCFVSALEPKENIYYVDILKTKDSIVEYQIIELK